MPLLLIPLLLAAACALPPPQSENLSEADVAALTDAELLAVLTGDTVSAPAAGAAVPAPAANVRPLPPAKTADIPPSAAASPPAAGDEASAITDAEFLAQLGVGANQGEVLRCDNSQYVCVPYYLCEKEEIITDGAGLIDIRFGDKQQSNGDTEPVTHSECPSFTDVCCRKPHPKVKPEPVVYQPRCGLRHQLGVNARITGFADGQSQFGEFPWMGAVLRVETVGDQEKNLFVCGAALIHEQVVMTAAHCVHSANSGELVVRLGEWDTQHTTEFYKHVDVRVADILLHPNFNGRNLHNDIALLFLAEPVPLEEHIDTLCLPEPNLNLTYTDCVVTGWGKDRFDGGEYQTVLKMIDLKRVSNEYCQQQLRTTRLGKFYKLDDSFTCAGAPPPQTAVAAGPTTEGTKKPAADACTGDGGSPLACRDPNDASRYVHGGIVAFGIGCGEKDIPGVYADPQYFVGWIDEHVSTYFKLAKPYYGFWEPAASGQQP